MHKNRLLGGLLALLMLLDLLPGLSAPAGARAAAETTLSVGTVIKVGGTITSSTSCIYVKSIPKAQSCS